MPVAAPGGVGSLTRGISAGGLHGCALFQSSASGNIVPVCAGNNSNGQLGTGNQTASNTFVRVLLANTNQDFFKVSAGGRHSCALNITGRLTSTPGGTDFSGSAFCWGDNSFGQVGQSSQQSWLTPTLVHQP
jgi:alpha-tubulin suppressor-like RCC1 family protein